MVGSDVSWPDEVASRFHIVADVISAALQHKQTANQLQDTLQELQNTRRQLSEMSAPVHKKTIPKKFLENMVYKSAIMSEVFAKVEQVASTQASVLLCGETGTGKEIIASLIHALSPRSHKAMVSVNCGAIPAALVESEMFGREKGAYTGALSRQIGRFELANESTIFLDEITDLPIEVQVKLLRVLQEKVIERLGNPKPIPIDVRVIAATNRSAEDAVKEGKFRADLYYRLNVFPIEVPPLRERREDIPLLIWFFVDQIASEFGKKVESISASSMEALTEYSWPGNIRELRNTIERAMILLNSPVLNIEVPKDTPQKADFAPVTLREMELQHILRVLQETKWKIRGANGAAQILGMKPTTLETRMARLGIVRPKPD